MKIALIGYGKMGKAIEAICLERNHIISLKIDVENRNDFTNENLSHCDVAIEFTAPEMAAGNILRCFEAGVPVVCGTTGWMDHLEEVKKICLEKQSAFVYASNYSIGVNIFFEVNKKLAELMAKHPNYAVSIDEIHHTQKKDAPSGTAITLAEQIIHAHPGKTKWINDTNGDDKELLITSKRIDPAPGTHSVKYSSSIDDIEIIHTAHNRTGFALGAVLAAEFIIHKKGIFGMKDVLGL